MRAASYPACDENERKRQCGYFPFLTFAFFKYGSNLTGADVLQVLECYSFVRCSGQYDTIQRNVFLPNVWGSGVATVSET